MKKKTAQPSLFHRADPDPFAAEIVKRDQRDLGLLALDIAAKTGWCTRTGSGVWNLNIKKDESKGMRLIRFRAKLREICEAEQVKLIVFEAPAVFGAYPNFVAIEMMGVLKLHCTEHDIDHKAYAPATLQKFATGKGKAGKELMIQQAVLMYGVSPEDHNEADALHLYHLAIEDLKL